MKKLTIYAIALVFVLAGVAFVAHPALANPSFFNRFQTQPATTTLAYMTPGTGTTTITAINSTNNAFTSATLNLQVTATSTGVASSVLANVRVEASMDNVDWYPIAVVTTTATTSLLTTNPYNSYSLVLATSTVAQGGTGSATLMMRSFDIPVKERHLRAVISNPAGGGNYGVWGEIVTQQQTN